MATSGSFTTTGYSDSGYPDRLVFQWSLKSQSTSGNYSVITWTVKPAGGQSSGYYTYVYNASVTVNGSTSSKNPVGNVYNTTTVFSGETIIYHDANGKKTFSASAVASFYYSGSNNSKGSSSWALPDIPRGSVINGYTNELTLNGTSAITVNLTRYVSTYTHNVKFTFGNHSYTATGVGTSTKYVIPLSWMDAFGNPAIGSKTGIITVTTYNGSTIVGSADTATFTLKSLGASTFEIENTNIICDGSNTIKANISRKSSSFVHKAVWKFGGKTYTLNNQGASASYAPPTSWLVEVSEVYLGTGTLEITTMYGNQQVGQPASKQFTLNVPSYDLSLSSVGVAVVQDSSISDWTVFVQKFSKAKFTFNGASSSYGANIKEYKVTIESKNYSGTSTNYTSDILQTSGNVAYTAQITDTRNKTKQIKGTINVMAVVPLRTVSAEIYRYDGTKENVLGEQLYFKFSFLWDSYDGFNSTTNQIFIKSDNESTYTMYGTFSNGIAKVINNYQFDYHNGYDIRVYVKDELGNELYFNKTIISANSLVDVDGINNSVAFLKRANRSNYVQVGGNLEVDGISEFDSYIMPKGGQYVHSARGTNGTAGYVKIAQLQITGTWCDMPIKMAYSRRGRLEEVLEIVFTSIDSDDPTLNSFTTTRTCDAYLHKSATSTWDLYILKATPWDEVNITRYYAGDYIRKRVLVTWDDVHANTLPNGAQQCTVGQLYTSELHVSGYSYFSSFISVRSGKASANDGVNGSVLSSGSLELTRESPFIDFHSANSTADYTSRIIDTSSQLELLPVNNKLAVRGNIFGGTNKDRRVLFLDEFNTKVLWEGGAYMNASQVITLSESVTSQLHGIVLCWSYYLSGTAYDQSFNYNFIPKMHVEKYSGRGLYVPTITDSGEITCKYLYVSSTTITGYSENNVSPRDKIVLRYVLGV